MFKVQHIYVKLVDALKDCGFKGIQVDPCLWSISILADDFLTIGTDESIKEVIDTIKVTILV